MKAISVDLSYIKPGQSSFEYQGETWTWKKTTNNLKLVGTDRKGLWGVFTNGVNFVRIYRGELIEALGENAAAQIFDRQTYPEKCYVFLISTGEIGVITRGEKGYKPVNVNFAGLDNRTAVDRLNAALGVSKAHAAAMMAGSIFGWDCPAARPQNYTQDGTAIKPKPLDRELR